MEEAVEISSRNQLRATIVRIERSAIMSEVIMRLGDGQELVSAITTSSVERLNLQVGDEVFAIVKATEVMVGVDS